MKFFRNLRTSEGKRNPFKSQIRQNRPEDWESDLAAFKLVDDDERLNSNNLSFNRRWPLRNKNIAGKDIILKTNEHEYESFTMGGLGRPM